MTEEVVTWQMVNASLQAVRKKFPPASFEGRLVEFEWYDEAMYDVLWCSFPYKQTLRYIQQAHKNFKRRGLNLKDAPFYPELKRLQYLMEVRRSQQKIELEVALTNRNTGEVNCEIFTHAHRALRWVELNKRPDFPQAILFVWRGTTCMDSKEIRGYSEIRRVLAQLDRNFPEECR